MSAMKWIQEYQEGSTELWDISQSVAILRASLEESRKEEYGGWSKGFRKYLQDSRAVHISGPFSTFRNIPLKFAEVLCGGSKVAGELADQHRMLTISGFLVPERTNAVDEFVRYNWTDETTRYGISNSLMAEYYGDVL